MFSVFQLWVCVLCFLGCVSEAFVSCLNEDGRPVDWFIIYKLPMYKTEVKGSGLEYMYLDPTVMKWQTSNHPINSSQGALGRTLTQLYYKYTSNSSGYVIYNDAPPELQYQSRYGHTKGVILLDRSQGFWLTHSVPHFPPFPERGYGYPSTGKYYGQTLNCITYNYTQFPLISQQLAFLYPWVYNCSVPLAFRSQITVMAQICDAKSIFIKTPKNWVKLLSKQGQLFFSFAKSSYYVDDIYTGWVAQTLGTDLLVESWMHKGHQLGSNCSLLHHVMNIRRVCLPGPQTFSSYEDHSKWCVSDAFKDQWTCLGDLNRDSAQTGRGGGLICSQNPIIYEAFRQAMGGYKPC